MNGQNWMKEMEDEFSYSRLCKSFNALQKALLNVDSTCFQGCDLPLFDPELFQWRWVREPWSVNDGIMLEVCRVNPHITDDPRKYPLSQKLSARDDALHVRLVTGQVGYALAEKLSSERKYLLPEDFQHIIDDLTELLDLGSN